LLCQSVDAHQDAAGQITDQLRRVVIDFGGMQAARFTSQAETEFSTPLGGRSR
jgi:hypothetical protein